MKTCNFGGTRRAEPMFNSITIQNIFSKSCCGSPQTSARAPVAKPRSGPRSTGEPVMKTLRPASTSSAMTICSCTHVTGVYIYICIKICIYIYIDMYIDTFYNIIYIYIYICVHTCTKKEPTGRGMEVPSDTLAAMAKLGKCGCWHSQWSENRHAMLFLGCPRAALLAASLLLRGLAPFQLRRYCPVVHSGSSPWDYAHQVADSWGEGRNTSATGRTQS